MPERLGRCHVRRQLGGRWRERSRLAHLYGRRLSDEWARASPVELGHEPQHGGMVVALAAPRELSNIPAMTAADAARELGVSTARVTQLTNAGLLDSWKEAAAWCPRLPLKHGSKTLQKSEGQNPQWHNQKADSRRRATSPATMRGFFFAAIPETCSIHEERLSQYNARAHAPRDAPPARYC